MTTPAHADVPIVGPSRLAAFIARKFAQEPKLARLGVRGEVSNLHASPRGNLYFDLKDRDAMLKCIAFSEAAATFPPFSDGDEIVAIGGVQTYPQGSVYQLRVSAVDVGGVGALHQRYEALKKRLAAEGLFATERKRRVPKFPFHVALVTSPGSDAERDFRTKASLQAPHVRISLIPTPVQGDAAAPEIVAALARAARLPVDLIVLARGGGSFEDLFVFSDERVVRAIVASPKPVISAIGHEADAPLSDAAADARASTPSLAAETYLPRREDLLVGLAQRKRRLTLDLERIVRAGDQRLDRAEGKLRGAVRERLRALGDRLGGLERRLAREEPSTRLALRAQRLGALRDRLNRCGGALVPRRRDALDRAAVRLAPAVRTVLERKRGRLERFGAQIGGLNPETILQRGYAIVRDSDGRLLKDAAAAGPGSRITARLARGRISARVESGDSDGGRQIELF